MTETKKLKIFFASASNIQILGATRSIDLHMVNHLANQGHDVTWFGINLKQPIIFSGEIVTLNEPKPILLFNKIKNKLLRILGVQSGEDQKLIEQQKFDNWLSNTLENKQDEINKNTIFIGRAVSSLKSFKTIKKYGGFSILHSQWLHPISHKKTLTKAFNDLNVDYNPVPDKRTQIQLQEINLCNKIWCISQLVYDSYIDNGIPEKKLFLNTLGVDTNTFKPNKKLSTRDSNMFTIIFIGNINIEKGIHILFESLLLLKIPNCKLVLNGAVADYFQSRLDEYCKKLRLLSNIEIVIKSGFPLENLQKADLFVLPSLHESFGLVVPEAMACGLPVIVTNQVGAKDHIIDGENGFVIQAGSAIDLSEKIIFFYNNNDRSRLNIYGEKSYEASQELNWKYVTENFSNSIESFVNV
jgi:glycosyltransferase involved in cell wall biosynthesis